MQRIKTTCTCKFVWRRSTEHDRYHMIIFGAFFCQCTDSQAQTRFKQTLVDRCIVSYLSGQHQAGGALGKHDLTMCCFNMWTKVITRHATLHFNLYIRNESFPLLTYTKTRANS